MVKKGSDAPRFKQILRFFSRLRREFNTLRFFFRLRRMCAAGHFGHPLCSDSNLAARSGTSGMRLRVRTHLKVVMSSGIFIAPGAKSTPPVITTFNGRRRLLHQHLSYPDAAWRCSGIRIYSFLVGWYRVTRT